MQHFRRPAYSIALLLIMLSSQVLAQLPTTATQEGASSPAEITSEAKQDIQNLLDDINLDLDLKLNEEPLSSEESEIAELITQRISTTEWLGALAPVALSPFFGLTCLSGIAILGEDHLPDNHFLKRASSPLRNPLVFLTFLVLTVLTSIPKFSKVSKPFAQAVDQLEAYSALIILLVIRFVGNIEVGPPEEEMAMVVYKAGIFEFSAESLHMLATIVNIIVINTVKFFFEVLIWITPVPFIDAIFEASNKALCLLLSAIYAFSPTIATIINLLLLAACLLAFRWVKRREVYYRSVLFDFVRHWLNFGTTAPSPAALTVFPQANFQGIKKLSKCTLRAAGDDLIIEQLRWFRPRITKTIPNPTAEIRNGLLMNSLKLDGVDFKFGKRHQRHLASMASQLKLRYNQPASQERTTVGLATELA